MCINHIIFEAEGRNVKNITDYFTIYTKKTSHDLYISVIREDKIQPDQYLISMKF